MVKNCKLFLDGMSTFCACSPSWCVTPTDTLSSARSAIYACLPVLRRRCCDRCGYAMLPNLLHEVSEVRHVPLWQMLVEQVVRALKQCTTILVELLVSVVINDWHTR